MYNYDYFYREEETLGKTYGEKMGLTARQISWLDRFFPPENAFLDSEPMLEAVVLLYLAVLPELERQLKTTGSTLAKTVKMLDEEAHSLAYQNGYWYNNGSRSTKAGADIYQAIFRLCEGVARVHYNCRGKTGKLFTKSLAGLELDFDQQLGDRTRALLPKLAAHLPPLSDATEQLLNKQNPNRWKPEFARLDTLLPAKVPAFLKGFAKLAHRNAENPNLELLHFEAAKVLVRADREAALCAYLHYLHNGARWLWQQPKVWPATLEKVLFSEPVHQQRFDKIVDQLEKTGDRPAALAAVATVYVRERKKIALDLGAVRTAHVQHADTVQLLNEYLRDETERPAASPTAATKPGELGKPTKSAKPAKASEPAKPAKPAKTPAAAPALAKVPAPPGSAGFDSSLTLSAVQQELLLLFARRKFVLPQAEVEAFARQHGTFRNQLIDGLNDACAALLDDVLVEEAEADYTIYEAYFQKIKN